MTPDAWESPVLIFTQVVAFPQCCSLPKGRNNFHSIYLPKMKVKCWMKIKILVVMLNNFRIESTGVG